jgi:hypothetical protein
VSISFFIVYFTKFSKKSEFATKIRKNNEATNFFKQYFFFNNNTTTHNSDKKIIKAKKTNCKLATKTKEKKADSQRRNNSLFY